MFVYFCTLNQISRSRRISCIIIQSNLKLGGHLTDIHFAEYNCIFFVRVCKTTVQNYFNCHD